MILKLMRTLLGAIVYCLLMTFYVPIYLLGLLMIQKNLFVFRMKKFFGIGLTYSRLGLLSRKSRITDVLQVSTDEEIDFQANRSGAYIKRMALWTPGQLVKTLKRKQTIQLMSDEQLVYVILSTVYAHSVSWDEEYEMYRLKMDGFEDLFLFEGFYWDARHVLVRPDASKIIIQMEHNQEFHSDVTDPIAKADYDLAKLHVQICLSYFAPGLSHNHVHFVFPSAVCLMSKLKLHHDSVLYKLLSPHFRFTERINYQALRVGKATNNKRSQLDRFFFFWQAFPVTKEQFMEGVARKCKIHYLDQGACQCEDKSLHDLNPLPSVSNGNGAHMPSIKEDDHCIRKHFLFPPNYVTDQKLQKIPYLAFLREYYLVVRRFVKAMVPFIDKKDWEVLSSAVTQFVPRFDEVEIVDAITTFIHQVGVVHYCDHATYLKYFAYRYGCMAIRTPFESFKSEDYWKDVASENGLDLESVMKNPLLLIRQRDVMRTRCFLNLFVDYIPNPKCNMRLIKTNYDFEEAGAQLAEKNFKIKLRELDEKLKTQTPPSDIPAKPTDTRADGLRLTELDFIVRSVCF